MERLPLAPDFLAALTVAGSDPTGGAGLQADLRVFERFGVHGLSVVAALTAQATGRVSHVNAVEPEMIAAQLETLLSDLRPAALKTGMLYTAETVEALAGAMDRYKLTNLVIDPVNISSTGTPLSLPGAMEVLRDKLLPLARAVTPNMQEAALLTGMEVRDLAGMEQAARRLMDMGPEFVVVTGGHLEDRAVDVYLDSEGIRRLEAAMLPGKFHGTGCAFSAALTALLALGHAPFEAVAGAKRFVRAALEQAARPGQGMAILRYGGTDG